MNINSISIAKLCANCEQGALFQDDQDFLHAAIDANNRHILAQSAENALRATPSVHLCDDILPELPSLVDSAQKGCGFCGFLRDIILAEETKYEIRNIFGPTFASATEPCHISIFIHFRWKYEIEKDSRGNGLLGANVSLRFRDETEILLVCVAEGFSGSEASDIWLGLGAPSHQDYYEPKRIEWMTKVLHQDLESVGRDEAFVPERLITVDANPHLVLRTDKNGFGSRTPLYAALSYCWGAPNDAKHQLTTTKDSIAERRKGIANHEMPNVLKDAIQVTHALKIPYLWIDSLCILQDDISDWERQCSDIAILYAQACVTICAASSNSCHEGFLRQRGCRVRMPFQSVRRPNLSGTYYLQFKWAGMPPGQIISEEVADSIHSRWGNRGWVFQESTSASRKLVFGNSNVYYYSTSSLVKTMNLDGTKKANHLALSHLSSMSKEEIYRSWALILREYARFEEGSFTSSKDVLPALSGLAAYYSKWLHNKYLAGLWKDDLFRGLMWSCEGDSDSLPERDCCLSASSMRHNDVSLPSWSPLARGVSVTHALYKDDHGFSHFEPEYQILDAFTQPAGRNPFGEIKSDWGLRIVGHILSMVDLDIKKLRIDDIFDELNDSRGILSYDGKHIGHFELDFLYGEPHDDSPAGSSACMMNEISCFSWILLGSCKVKALDDPKDKTRRARGACGLVLYSPPKSNIFFRVGIFFPALPEHHHDGLYMIRKLGEKKAIIVT